MSKELVTKEEIQHKIYKLRGKVVMIDKDLGDFYGEETRRVNEVRKRNSPTFEGLAFQITREELEDLTTSQSAILNYKGGHLPWVYTERGAFLLSFHLRSERAVYISSLIMDAFEIVKGMIAEGAPFLKKSARQMEIIGAQIQDLEKELKGRDIHIYNVAGNLYIGSSISSSAVTNDLEAIARLMAFKEQISLDKGKEALHQAAEALRDKEKDKSKIMKALDGLNTVMDTVTKSDAAYAILLPAYEMLKAFL